MKNSESNSNVFELAKQGNPRATADLLNGQLRPKGIIAIVTKDRYFDKEESLKIVFEYEQAKSRKKILIFVQKFFQKINPESISSVVIYGRRKGNDASDWSGEIRLNKFDELKNNIDCESKALESESEKEKIEIISTKNQLDLVVKTEENLSQNSFLTHEFMLKLEKLSGLAVERDFEDAKLMAEELLICLARHDNDLDWSEGEKVNFTMQVLYVKAMCYAFTENIAKALTILYSALDNSNTYAGPELEFASKIKESIDLLETVKDKSTVLMLEFSTLEEGIQTEGDDSKKVKNNKLNNIDSEKRSKSLSPLDKFLIYFFLFIFSFSILSGSYMGGVFQLIISIFVAGCVIVSLTSSKGWNGKILVSSATTFLLFPVGLLGFYFVWRNSFAGKRMRHFSAAFVGFLLPYILIAFNPANKSVNENLQVPSKVEIENQELNSDDYPRQVESIEQEGKCQDELIARGASVREILEVCTPKQENIVPLTYEEVEVIACIGIVKDPSHPYYLDCIDRGY